jgi:hypothetical protein
MRMRKVPEPQNGSAMAFPGRLVASAVDEGDDDPAEGGNDGG